MPVEFFLSSEVISIKYIRLPIIESVKPQAQDILSPYVNKYNFIKLHTKNWNRRQSVQESKQLIILSMNFWVRGHFSLYSDLPIEISSACAFSTGQSLTSGTPYTHIHTHCLSSSHWAWMVG